MLRAALNERTETERSDGVIGDVIQRQSWSHFALKVKPVNWRSLVWWRVKSAHRWELPYRRTTGAVLGARYTTRYCTVLPAVARSSWWENKHRIIKFINSSGPKSMAL